MKIRDEKLAVARVAAEKMVAHKRVAAHPDENLIVQILANSGFWLLDCYVVAEREVEALRAEVAGLRAELEFERTATLMQRMERDREAEPSCTP